MLDWSIEQNEHPVAIRMPGGALVSDGKAVTKDFGRLNTYEVTEKGSKGRGHRSGYVLRRSVNRRPALDRGKDRRAVRLLSTRTISPAWILTLLEEPQERITTWSSPSRTAYSTAASERRSRSFYGDSDVKVLNFGLKKEFLDRYDVDEVLKDNHLTAEQIAEDVEKVL